LHPASPQFFTFNGLDFAYNVRATSPKQWLTFLASLWPDDQESINTVQELSG